MTNRNTEPRFDGGNDRIGLGSRVLPYQSGELPEDFLARLNRLKRISGLTWSAFSQVIGVDRKQVRRWRKKGVEPSGGAYHSLARFATHIPGGLETLLGDGFQIDLWDEEDEEEPEDEEQEEER